MPGCYDGFLRVGGAYIIILKPLRARDPVGRVAPAHLLAGRIHIIAHHLVLLLLVRGGLVGHPLPATITVKHFLPSIERYLYSAIGVPYKMQKYKLINQD